MVRKKFAKDMSPNPNPNPKLDPLQISFKEPTGKRFKSSLLIKPVQKAKREGIVKALEDFIDNLPTCLYSLL